MQVSGEVEDPILQLKVLPLCIVSSTADGRVSQGESAVIRAAVSRWGWCLGHPAPASREAACRS